MPAAFEPWSTLWGFLLVLFRTAGLCATAPIWGASTIPLRVRAGLAVVVAAVLFSSATPVASAPTSLAAFAGPALLETLLGLATGLGARIALDAALTAGHLASTAMGLSFGSLIDPLHGGESAAVAQLLGATALALAVELGLHREAIFWLVRSVLLHRPASASLETMPAALVAQAVSGIALAVRLAFPVLAAVTLGHLLTAVLNRTTPQVALSSLGFGVIIFAGGLALYLCGPAAAAAAVRAAAGAFHR